MNDLRKLIGLFFVFLASAALCGLWAMSSETFEDKDEAKSSHAFTHNQIKRGERLFYGLIPLGEEAASCTGCHNTRELDTLSWYPSAYDIALTSAEKSLDELTAVLLNPEGEMMTKVHLNYDLPADDIALIKAYLGEVGHEGLTQRKPAIMQRFLFILAIVMMLVAIADLAVINKVKFKGIHMLIILAALFYVVQITIKESIAEGRSPGYAPDQPLKFSHQIHAGQNKIDCQYCHNTAEHSKSAGIPAAAVCLNCHQLVVKEGSRSGSFEINKIIRAVNNNEPIIWNRVYSLPDHVFFSHAQHVKVGEIECAECHGAVEEMDIIQQFNDLSMGWCINCHRDTEVQFVDNEFYKKYEQLHEELKNGNREMISAEDIGGTECMKCHY